ncbi:MAG: VOC family protein [Pseudomonadota bacterium]
MRFVNPIPFVESIEVSKRFYQQLLGLKVIEDHGDFVRFEHGFALHVGRALEFTVWGDVAESRGGYGRRNLLLYFEHEDVDASFSSIAPHVTLIHPVQRQSWGQRVFRFYDPDGPRSRSDSPSLRLRPVPGGPSMLPRSPGRTAMR